MTRDNQQKAITGQLAKAWRALEEAEFTQRDREIADYSIDETITADHARKRVGEARQLLERIELFLTTAGWSVTKS